MAQARGRRALVLAILLAGLVTAGTGSAVARRASPGTLDKSFGKHGRVLSPPGRTIVASKFTAIAWQPDGKLVIEDRRENGTEFGSEGVIERRLPDGSLDQSFGHRGELVVPEAEGLALQGDGDIVFRESGPGKECRGREAVRRLNPDGSVDRSFGKEGCGASIPFVASQIAVDGAGRIVIAGHASHGPYVHDVPPSQELVLARLLPGGGLDPSFGKDGIVRAYTDLGLGINEATGLALTEGGGLVVAGDRMAFRFTASGGLDSGFGNGGKVEVAGQVRSLLVLPDGKIVLASTSGSPSCCPESSDFVITRYLSDGSLDPGFGAAGIVTLDVAKVDEPRAIGLAPEGGVVLAGESKRTTECSLACEDSLVLARFEASGKLDAGYGGDGVADLGPSPEAEATYYPAIAAFAVAPSGETVIGGDSGFDGDAFLLAREPGGQASLGFGQGGLVVELKELASNTEASGIASEPNGALVVAAESNAGGHDSHHVLLNFGADGGASRAVGSTTTIASGQIGSGGRHALFSIAENGRDSVLRFEKRGQLDRDYGVDGRARLPAGFRVSTFLAQRDGSVIVVGRTGLQGKMAAYLLTARGRPARGFGHEGLALVSFGDLRHTEARSVLIEPDGRIVLVGWAGGQAAAARLLPDGRLDPDFGRRGRIASLIGPHTAADIVVRQGRGILVACEPEKVSGPDGVVLVRLNRSGRRVSSFGLHGVVRPGGDVAPFALFATRRGSTLITRRGWSSSGGVVLRAYRHNGAIDRQFGHRGMTVAASRQNRLFYPMSATRQPSGKIVVAGTAGAWFTGNSVELLRFN